MLSSVRIIPSALIFGLAVVMLSAGRADAYYLKKIGVAPVENESGWSQRFEPGKLVTGLLTGKIEKSGLMIVDEENGTHPSPADARPSDVAFPKHPAQLILKSRILEFEPGEKEQPRPELLLEKETRPQPEKKLSARVRIAFELVNGYTGRPFWTATLEHSAVNGDVPIGETPGSLDPSHPDFYKTAMGQALHHVTGQILERVFAFANRRLLEGQIVSIQTEDEETRVFLNIGAHNGIEVGDSFRVYQVSSRYKDPYNEQDLGYRYKKLGAIRILDVQPGFAIGVVRAGGNFSKGDVAQARRLKPVPEWKERKHTKTVTPEEPPESIMEEPSGPFARPIWEPPQTRATLTHFNLFDAMQFTLAY